MGEHDAGSVGVTGSSPVRSTNFQAFMRCIFCEKISLSLICSDCREKFLTPSLITRTLNDGFKIYSFYRYGDIEDLIKTKHSFLGSFIYKILAESSFRKFALNFKMDFTVYALPIDDVPKGGYSHTAILAKALESECVKPVFSSLRALNRVVYSGKSLAFRLENPRNFKYSFKRGVDAILVDDIVTTGSTIKEAVSVLKREGVNPLFALTLADAREK